MKFQWPWVSRRRLKSALQANITNRCELSDKLEHAEKSRDVANGKVGDLEASLEVSRKQLQDMTERHSAEIVNKGNVIREFSKGCPRLVDCKCHHAENDGVPLCHPAVCHYDCPWDMQAEIHNFQIASEMAVDERDQARADLEAMQEGKQQAVEAWSFIVQYRDAATDYLNTAWKCLEDAGDKLTQIDVALFDGALLPQEADENKERQEAVSMEDSPAEHDDPSGDLQ